MLISDVENEVITRTRGMLAEAGVSALTDGNNPDLRGPIRKAFAYATGRSTADLTRAANADLAVITTSARAERFFDKAALEALYSAYARLTDVDERIGDGEQKLSQLADRVLALIKILEADLLRTSYGSTVASMDPAPIPYDPFGPWTPRTRNWPYP